MGKDVHRDEQIRAKNTLDGDILNLEKCKEEVEAMPVSTPFEQFEANNRTMLDGLDDLCQFRRLADDLEAPHGIFSIAPILVILMLLLFVFPKPLRQLLSRVS